MKSSAEAAPVDGFEFGHGPAMTVAEVDLLIVFVIEFDRGPADMAFVGRNFAGDALALNLQGYFGRWKERVKFRWRNWQFSLWIIQFP